MGRFGFGFYGRYRGVAAGGGGGGGGQPLIKSIAPSAGWTGTASSGFTVAPADPVRTTAKPAIRLIVPPRQAFTDELVVGVYAGANDRGSMLNNMGLQRVVAHYEGASVIINEPSLRVFNDGNGHPVTYFGWWIKLKHNGIHGLANLYFEAVPSDTTMQNRVIGPYLFLPSAKLYDFDVEVASSLPEIAAKRYQTIGRALNYLRYVAAAHPRVLLTETYAGDIDTPDVPYAGAGYCTIEASLPVRFEKTYASRSSLRLKYDRIRFQGANITFDMRYIARLRPYNTGNFQFDGVNFVNSGGRDELWDKGERPAHHMASYAESQESPWFTECSFDNTADSAMDRAYARGCMFTNVSPDLADNCRLLLGCTINDIDNTEWRREINALTVQYVGAGAAATLSLSNNLGSEARVFTARVNGAVVGSFTAGGTSTDFAAGTIYDVADVVAWLNGLADWSATLLDDTRKAVQLGLANTNGNAFTNVDVKTGAVTLVTQIDYHPDIMQRLSADENSIVADNTGTNILTQIIFLNLYELKDMLIINNAFANKPKNSYFSQLSSNQSHVVIAHNTMAGQGMMLRADIGYIADDYCLIVNNSFASLQWYGPADTHVVISGNHLHASATVPSRSVGTTLGGDEASLYTAAALGNFRPVGALLNNLKPPILKYDQSYRMRVSFGPAGAFC